MFARNQNFQQAVSFQPYQIEKMIKEKWFYFVLGSKLIYDSSYIKNCTSIEKDIQQTLQQEIERETAKIKI